MFEDDHLLVVNKPAGLNTHSPSPFAGEGIYEWLRHREPRWARLAIVHRLDKEHAGILAFSKSEAGNRSLTDQFARHTIRRDAGSRPNRSSSDFTVAALVEWGKVCSRPPHAAPLRPKPAFAWLIQGRTTLIEAQPITGKTHQIRVHAAEIGSPILGDTLYGGTPAARLHLHAPGLTLQHPATARR